ncbi:MAG TPA: chorismate--pyruvate lyase [Candidatus Accumulibacter sp.]|nr:chorismate--pyruvate lyase [Accumulibacter sp.]
MRSGHHQRWHSRLLRTAGNVPFKSWLRDRGSLTARIQARGRFTVRVLRQGLGIPTADEARALGIAPGTLAWVREVALLADDQVVVFAHTVLPRRPRGPLLLWLARLGNHSLGALLFSQAGFTRGAMQFRALDQRHALFAPARRALQLAGPAPDPLWARRSYFGFGVQAVLVTEVFAPRVLHLGDAGENGARKTGCDPN